MADIRYYIFAVALTRSPVDKFKLAMLELGGAVSPGFKESGYCLGSDENLGVVMAAVVMLPPMELTAAYARIAAVLDKAGVERLAMSVGKAGEANAWWGAGNIKRPEEKKSQGEPYR